MGREQEKPKMIMCMASGDENKGVITEEACLECALANGNNTPCGFDYTLLKYIYSKERYMEEKVHVSDILGCPRQAYFSKKFKLPLEAHKHLIVTFGTLQHQMLEEMEDEFYSAEKILSNSGIVGTADVYYKDGRIVDYKTTRNLDRRYLPRKKHKMQVNIYAHLLRQDGYDVTSAAIQYIDFMGPSKCPKHKAFVVPGNKYPRCPICDLEQADFHLGAMLMEIDLLPEDEVEDLIKEKSEYLQNALDNEIIPEAEADFLCRYCPYVSWCQEGRDSIYV